MDSVIHWLNYWGLILDVKSFKSELTVGVMITNHPAYLSI